MANESEILRRIRAMVGLDMSRSADYDVLSQAIRDRTKENLGVNTLNRLFGFKTDRLSRGSRQWISSHSIWATKIMRR